MKIGTRGSALALAQAGTVADMLGDDAELVPITTYGDRNRAASDKEKWVKELESALLAGAVDLAIHSAKDVPSELPDGLELVATPARADARDVLCGASSLAELAAGACVGTSSLRRAAQLLALRDDLRIASLRGNVDTRLGRLAEGAYDAIVLAGAGLVRLGRSDAIGGVLDDLVPAPGQGTLVLEARTGDAGARRAAEAICDPDAWTCLIAERALVRGVNASCHTPLGAYATIVGEMLVVETFAGLPDGSRWLRDRVEGAAGDPEGVGALAAERMLAAGGGELLREAEAMAAAS